MEKKTNTNRGLSNHQAGEVGFGLMIILFMIALFIVWYFTGGPARQEDETPFLKVQTPST